MKQPGQVFSDDELRVFGEQAVDLRARLAASGINFSYDTCWMMVILKWVEEQQAEMAVSIAQIKKDVEGW